MTGNVQAGITTVNNTGNIPKIGQPLQIVKLHTTNSLNVVIVNTE